MSTSKAERRILNILRGPEADRIRFKIPGGFTVDRRAFLRVARAIRHNDDKDGKFQKVAVGVVSWRSVTVAGTGGL